MRKVICGILLLFLPEIAGYCQDTLTREGKNETAPYDTIKTGWNFGALPTFAYDSDLGFMYGGLIGLYNYGDGSRYPMYDHYFFILASKYTKGSGMVVFQYDSDRLLTYFRTLLDIRYFPEPKRDFFGFNGYEAKYNAAWTDDQDTLHYHTKVFYAHEQKKIMVRLDLRHRISTTDFLWLTGFAVYRYFTGPVDIARLNRNKDPQEMLPDVPGLFEHYTDWGIIPAEDRDGGWLNYLKGGIMYDSRDNEPNPMRGVWSEVSLEFAPSFLGNGDHPHILLNVIHRQYFTLVKNRLSFVYRLSYKGPLAGKIPFYGYSRYGLGGSSSLRGIMRLRVDGPGVTYGNGEFRWKFWYTHIRKQNFYLALSTFCDAGMVVQKEPVNKDRVVPGPGESLTDYFTGRKESPHVSLGAGLHIAMNENFIVACDYGRALHPQDGISGLYINLDFLF